MTKEQFLNKYFSNTGDFQGPMPLTLPDLEAVIAHEIAKAKGEVKPVPNPILVAYYNGVKIREVNLHKPKWIKKHTITQAVDDTGHYWHFIEDLDFTTNPEKWELYTEAEAEAEKPAPNPIAEMTEKEKIEYITNNKLTHKDCPNKTWYAMYINGYSPYIGGYRYRVKFYYGDKHMMWQEYDTLDLSEWQPVGTDQVAPKFDKERFEAMFRAVVASGGFYEDSIKATEHFISKLDAYYASKKGGNNE